MTGEEWEEWEEVRSGGNSKSASKSGNDLGPQLRSIT